MDVRSDLEANDSAEDVVSTLETNGAARKQTTTNEQSVRHKAYTFRMRYFFYIHLILFVASGLLAGLIIYLIENYSAARNQQIAVSYVDAWFVSCTCAYSCGLTTLNFAKLSTVSQIILLVVTFFSGITISTLPALVIKAYTHKSVEGTTVDNDHEDGIQKPEDIQRSSPIQTLNRSLPAELEKKLAQLPTPCQIRYWSYITIIVLILLTCASLYLCYFVIIGAWLYTRYPGNKLADGNSTINPWYASIIIVVTGFNQNGLTPFSDGLTRFVNDVYVNIFVMMVIMSGTSLFPFLLRNVVLLGRRLIPWRYKIVFDYILLNHHHLSTLLFPTLQTRIYLAVTIVLYLVAVSISLILDLHNLYLAQFTYGIRFLIFMFHAVSARFAGFQTFDISHFTSATLIIYLLLMVTKPQMLCALSTSRFELTWISLQSDKKGEKEEEEEQQPDPPMSNSVDNIPVLRRRVSAATSSEASLERRMNLYFDRQRYATKELVHKTKRMGDDKQKYRYLSHLHFRLFLLKFVQAICKHTAHTFGQTRTWLIIFIFLVCAIEYERVGIDPNITVFKVVFEMVSAFGCVGLSLGYPGVASSFTTVLLPTSRVIVGLTMLLGRHRGLYASLEDQEEIEHSASDLLKKWREETIHQWESSAKEEIFLTRL